jgi:hypothetical protein
MKIEEILVDPEGEVHRLHPITKKWKIKYAASNTKPVEMKADKLSTLQRLIRGEKPISFDNRQTHQTKAASSSDKKTVDFQMDSDRIPRPVQEKQKLQRKDDERFAKEVEAMQAAKSLNVLQTSYRNRGIVI